MEDDFDYIEIPDDELPDIDELTGDLRIIAEIVGVSKALKIGQRFHGVPIRIWNTLKFILRHRNKRMIRDFDNGMSGLEIAKKYRMSDRHVWRILGEPEPESKQLGLFG